MSMAQLNQVKEDRMGRACSMDVAKRNAYWILVEKPERKRPVGRQSCRGRIILKWILGWGVMDWIDLAQDRDQWRALVNTVMNLHVPWNVGKFLNG
jgi:hypothetical protein